MNFDELKRFTKWERERLRKSFPAPDSEDKIRIFTRMTKITEELGELCEAVLSFYSLQRKDKNGKDKSDVEKEIADVIIGVSLLAEQMDIDVEKALENKIEIIKSRKY